MTDRCFLMESCPSWSKEHDWKSCNESTLIRGFESLALRHIKEQTLIQKQPSFLEGCFCIYARKAHNIRLSGLFLFSGDLVD